MIRKLKSVYRFSENDVYANFTGFARFLTGFPYNGKNYLK